MTLKPTKKYHLTCQNDYRQKHHKDKEKINSTNIKCWWGGRKNREHWYSIDEIFNWWRPYRNSTEALQKAKSKNTVWFSNSTPGYVSEENENINSKGYTHPHVSIIYNSKDMETTQMSTDAWMDKENDMRTHKIFSHKKNETSW